MKKLNSENRLHHSHIPIIAITGNIGTGKSTVLEIIKSKNYLTINADLLVKKIYQDSNQVREALKKYKDHKSFFNGKEIHFPKLRKAFFEIPELKKELEDIIYRELPHYFQEMIQGTQGKLVFYEVPLLFELKLQEQVDYIVLAYLNEKEQIERVKARDKNSIEMIKNVFANQLPMQQKVKLADTVLDTSNKDTLTQEISELLIKLDELFS